jgi:hypothetical protein
MILSTSLPLLKAIYVVAWYGGLRLVATTYGYELRMKHAHQFLPLFCDAGVNHGIIDFINWALDEWVYFSRKSSL